jgi:hypothetical protein
MVEHLVTFFFHPCMERSRVRVCGEIPRRMKRGFLELNQEWR